MNVSEELLESLTYLKTLSLKEPTRSSTALTQVQMMQMQTTSVFFNPKNPEQAYRIENKTPFVLYIENSSVEPHELQYKRASTS